MERQPEVEPTPDRDGGRDVRRTVADEHDQRIAAAQPYGTRPLDGPLARREQVVRRLLDRGLSPRLLAVLLPDWQPLIDRVARR
jgi:hypothetical protein